MHIRLLQVLSSKTFTVVMLVKCLCYKLRVSGSSLKRIGFGFFCLRESCQGALRASIAAIFFTPNKSSSCFIKLIRYCIRCEEAGNCCGFGFETGPLFRL